VSKATQEAKRATDLAWYTEQVLSLGSNGRLPYEEPARRVMVDVLMRETTDRAHAERAIAAALAAAAPEQWSLGELRNFIGATKQRAVRRDLNCPECGGTGWKWIERMVRIGGLAPVINSACVKCSRGCEPAGMSSIWQEATR